MAEARSGPIPRRKRRAPVRRRRCGWPRARAADCTDAGKQPLPITQSALLRHGFGDRNRGWPGVILRPGAEIWAKRARSDGLFEDAVGMRPDPPRPCAARSACGRPGGCDAPAPVSVAPPQTTSPARTSRAAAGRSSSIRPAPPADRRKRPTQPPIGGLTVTAGVPRHAGRDRADRRRCRARTACDDPIDNTSSARPRRDDRQITRPRVRE